MVCVNQPPFFKRPLAVRRIEYRPPPGMKELTQNQIDKAILALKEAYRKGDILEMKREGADTLAIVRITRKVEERAQ